MKKMIDCQFTKEELELIRRCLYDNFDYFRAISWVHKDSLWTSFNQRLFELEALTKKVHSYILEEE